VDVKKLKKQKSSKGKSNRLYRKKNWIEQRGFVRGGSTGHAKKNKKGLREKGKKKRIPEKLQKDGKAYAKLSSNQSGRSVTDQKKKGCAQ